MLRRVCLDRQTRHPPRAVPARRGLVPDRCPVTKLGYSHSRLALSPRVQTQDLRKRLLHPSLAQSTNYLAWPQFRADLRRHRRVTVRRCLSEAAKRSVQPGPKTGSSKSREKWKAFRRAPKFPRRQGSANTIIPLAHLVSRELSRPASADKAGQGDMQPGAWNGYRNAKTLDDRRDEDGHDVNKSRSAYHVEFHGVPSLHCAAASYGSAFARQINRVVLKPEGDALRREVGEQDGLGAHHVVVAVFAHGTHGQ
jgi:hypothetical protein